MALFHHPISENPLRTRRDVETALLQLLEPVEPWFTEGDAGFRLGAFAAHYGSDAARVEAFSRMLWGLAPLWTHKAEDRWLPRFRRGLVNGCNPQSPAYWGTVTDCDQKIVEMAAIALTLLLDGPALALTGQEAANVHAWLSQVNTRETPHNNWLFFRVLVNTAFLVLGWPCDRPKMERDLQELESFYLGDGWYCDGESTQMDYYISFAMHYYGLIYAKYMDREDHQRCQRFRERAAEFAGEYLYWFEDGGAAVPFGRSLTYRFGQCAFFSALAFAGVEALPWGVMKGRVLGNLRWWFSQPIFDAGGILTVGYAYPNLFPSENYNAPGSPYWALKAFLCLALPEDHPFWTAEEQVPVLEPVKALPCARMLAARDARQVQLFPAGQHCVNELGNCGAKYEKLVYSSAFGFSVPRGATLEEGAFDCCLAVSGAGENHYRTQRGFLDYRLEGDRYWRKFSPMPGVTVEVTVIPSFPAHRREYVITTDRPIDVADGGFAVSAEDSRGRPYTDDMVCYEPHGVTARFPWAVSGIRCEQGGEAVLVKAYPNTNLLHPLTRIPTVRLSFGSGTHRFTTVVTGDVPVQAERTIIK